MRQNFWIVGPLHEAYLQEIWAWWSSRERKWLPAVAETRANEQIGRVWKPCKCDECSVFCKPGNATRYTSGILSLAWIHSSKARRQNLGHLKQLRLSKQSEYRSKWSSWCEPDTGRRKLNGWDADWGVFWQWRSWGVYLGKRLSK